MPFNLGDFLRRISKAVEDKTKSPKPVSPAPQRHRTHQPAARDADPLQKIHDSSRAIARRHDQRAAERFDWLMQTASEAGLTDDELALIADNFPKDDLRRERNSYGHDIPLTVEQRPRLFDALWKIRQHRGFSGAVHTTDNRNYLRTDVPHPADTPLIAMECAFGWLMGKGFKPRADQAESILLYLREAPRRRSLGPVVPTVLGEQGPDVSLGIVIRLAALWKTRDGIPRDVLPLFDEVADSFLQIGCPNDWTGPDRDGQPSPPDVDALLTLTNRRRPPLLEQAARIPSCRKNNANHLFRKPEFRDLLRKLDAAIAHLAQEFAEAGGKPAWYRDPQVYQETFGEWDCKKSLGDNAAFGMWDGRFGWWDRPESSPFVRFDSKAYAKMCEPDAFDGIDSLHDTALRLLNAPEDEDPVSFFPRNGPFGQNVPAPEFFTFQGRDPEGALLEHLVTLRTSKPTKAWLKTADALIDDIGRDIAGPTLDDWLGLIRELYHPAVQNIGDYMPRALHGLVLNHKDIDPDDPQSLNRHALYRLKTPFTLRTPTGKPDWTTPPQADAEPISAVVPPLPNFILTGVLALSPRLAPHISASRLAFVAVWAHRSAGHPAMAIRSRMAGNAAVAALAGLGTPEARTELEALLRRQDITDRGFIKQIRSALDTWSG